MAEPLPSLSAVEKSAADLTPYADSAPKPRVLIVGPLPPPLGGVQLLVEMLTTSNFAQEHELRVVNTSKGVLRWAVEKATWRTIPYFLRDLWRLIVALFRFPADVVIVHTAPNYAILRDWLFMLLARLWRKRVICHYHGTLHTPFPCAFTPFGRLAGRIIMAAAHRVIVLGPSYKEAFAKAWQRGNDIVWVPNCTEVTEFQATPSLDTRNETSAPWLAPNEMGVLFVGRLSKPKGIRDLFDAIPQVLAKHPQARFLLCGVAETLGKEAELRQAVRERGLVEKVTFLGSREGADKIRVWRSATIFVSPSHTEAFPLVIPEAMAAGIPMVVTDVGAISDFVKDGVDGFLVRPQDPGMLADRINRLLGDEALRKQIAQRLLARAPAEFSVEVHARAIREIVRDAFKHNI